MLEEYLLIYDINTFNNITPDIKAGNIMLNRIKEQLNNEGALIVYRAGFIFLCATLAAYEADSHHLSGLPPYDQNNNTFDMTTLANFSEGASIGFLIGVCLNATQLLIATNLNQSRGPEKLVTSDTINNSRPNDMHTHLHTLFASKKEKIKTIEKARPENVNLQLQ